MAILSPMGDVGETLLTTLATAAVFSTTESNFKEDLDTLLTKTTSKCSTKQLVEMEPLLDILPDSLPGETHDVEDGVEIDTIGELQVRSGHARVTTTRRATGTEDAFQSYLRDIRGIGLLTPVEEVDLARRAAAGNDLARRKLIESNLRLVIAIARR